MIHAWHRNQGKEKDMLKLGLDINSKQIEDMKHAIGFNQIKVKNGKYLAWRNYFTTSDSDESWDILVLQRMAIKRPFRLGKGVNPQCYSVTKEGIKYLENKLGIKIIMDRR